MSPVAHLGRRPLPPSAAQLAAALKRTTHMLSSARLAISDPVARGMATEAVEQSQALLRRFEGKPEPHARSTQNALR